MPSSPGSSCAPHVIGLEARPGTEARPAVWATNLTGFGAILLADCPLPDSNHQWGDSMPRPHLLAFWVVLPLFSCASAPTRPLRVVDCTQGAYCNALYEWPAPSWSNRHEALFRRGIGSILREMACGRPGTRGSKLAYVADDELSVACEHSPAQLHHVKDRKDADRLLRAGRIDYVVEFEKADATMVNGGIQVPFSASYYGKPPRAGADSRLEGVDNYLVVQTDKMAEVRLVSRAAL